MKVLFMNTVCGTGSTGGIILRLQNFFRSRGHETLFLYGRGDRRDLPDTLRVTSRPELYLNAGLARLFGTQGSLSLFSAAKIEREIKKFAPDAVVLGNIHGYYLNEKRLFGILKKLGIPTVYFMFDEYAFLGKCVYSGDCERYKTGCGHCPNLKDYPKTFADRSAAIFKQKLKNYANFDNLYFVSTPYNCERAKSSPLFAGTDGRVIPLGWGIDVQNVYRPTEFDAVAEKYGIDTKKTVILSVGELSDTRKGVEKVFFAMAEKCKDKSLQFIHVGNDDPAVRVPENCTSLPFIKDQTELSALFTLADLFVITSKIDTYPTVCLISQACGTPIAGFRASGVTGTGCPDTSFFADPDDEGALVAYVYSRGKKTDEVSRVCREYSLENFDAEAKARKLEDLIEKAVKKQS